jgi:hypothetical protein
MTQQRQVYPSMEKERTKVTTSPNDVSYVETEKIDGSNFAFESKADGTITCYTRNARLGCENVDFTGSFRGEKLLCPTYFALL